MSGVSLAIATPTTVLPLSIRVTADQYFIDQSPTAFNRTATDAVLQDFAESTLVSFKVLERAINKAKTVDMRQEPAVQQAAIAQTRQLAIWGMRAYRQFFQNKAARDALVKLKAFWEKRQMSIAPVFWSKLLPFPWELLYDGPDPEALSDEQFLAQFEADAFWGMRYPLARNLTDAPIFAQVEEQALPAEMLFCLHHSLKHAHQQEWPQLTQLVQERGQGQIRLLSQQQANSGKALLNYLDTAGHNMVHFACHCVPGQGEDSLLLSLIEDAVQLLEDDGGASPTVIKLGTFAFLDAEEGTFALQPLIFLNACQTTGDVDDVRLTFNLPQQFIDRGAAAVIATVCPVPDLFAAAFARKFYELFLEQRFEVGEALRATRWHFWSEFRNPLGLAYGLYSTPHYHLVSEPPQEEGLF